MPEPASPPTASLLTPAEAAAIILDDISPTPVECIPLPETIGRVLAADVQSPVNLPAWTNSAMDGYAVRRADLEAGVPRELTVVEEIAAGRFPTGAIQPGECARVFTGAPVPEGADTVVRQEDTTRLANRRVRIDDARDAGRNVRPVGEDIVKGSVVLRRGTLIGAAEMGLLASVAMMDVYVHRKPTVALLATGDEVAELDEADAILAGRKIASSNSYTMLAMTRLAGAEPVPLGIARDDPAAVRQRVQQAFPTDLFVSSGGVSVGEHDHLHGALEEMGLQRRFWRVRMRPGAPVGFGRVKGLPWIGLPGNPVSTMVTFELFVRPAIRRMLGHREPFRRTIPVRAGEPMETPSRLQHFLRVRLESDDDGLPTAYLTGPQGSGILTSMSKADALLVVPEERERVAPGDELRALRLDEPRHVSRVPF